MKKWMLAALVASVSLCVACQSAEEAASPSKGTAKVPAKAESPELQEPIDQLPKSGLPGEVLEVLHGGGYSFLRVRTGSGDLWAATAQVKVDVGATVVVPRGTKMVDFKSKSLDRTFKAIFFVEYVKGAEPVNKPVAAAPTSGPASAPASAPTSAPKEGAASAPAEGNPHKEKAKSPGSDAINPEVEISGLSKPEDGFTISEIYTGKAALVDKAVKVRGKVVKVNNQIMGKNWIHIQDGSGKAATGDHDLTITTSDTVKNGATVLIEGTLRVDKDFGAGYRFAVIVEDAKVTTEP